MGTMDDFLKDYIFSGMDDEGLTDNTTEVMRFLLGDDYRESSVLPVWDRNPEEGSSDIRSGGASDISAGTQHFENVSIDKYCVTFEAQEEFSRLEKAYYGYWITRLHCPYIGWNAGIESRKSGSGCFGCLDAQFYTYLCLLSVSPPPVYWNIVKVRIPGHSAVAVYERGKTIQDGYIFDPWKTQTPIVYKFHEWPFFFSFLVHLQDF